MANTTVPAPTAAPKNSVITRRIWAVMFLTSLGITPNKENVKAVVAWQLAESGTGNDSPGKTYSWNPLKTTLDGYGGVPKNNHGVRAYPSFLDGLNATLDTIRHPRYAQVMSALQRGSADQIAAAVVNSPWGTGAYFRNVVSRGIPKSSYDHAIGDAKVKLGNLDKLLTGPVGDAVEGATNLASKIPGYDLLLALGQGDTWKRVGFVVGGGILGIIGLLIMTKATSKVSKVVQLAPGPAGKAASVVANAT